MNISLDDAVRQVYGEFEEAVEPILSVSVLRGDYVGRVQHLCPEASEEEVLMHLLRLRKRGQDKGGLPRKSR